MLLNWCQEITNLDPSINFRYAGGWLKTVTGLDKSVLNGYSLVGEFVKSGDFKEEYSDGLYLDCNKTGNRLLRLKHGKLTLIDQVYDGRKNWAVEFWDSVSEELNPNYRQTEAEKIIDLILDRTGKDIKLLNEVQNQLDDVILNL